MKKVSTLDAALICFAFGFFFLVGIGSAMAQTSKKTSKSETQDVVSVTKDFPPAAAGTFQILAKDANSHESFPVDILIEIEKNRDQKKVVFINAGESSVIKILPYHQINSKNFVPVAEYGIQE